MPSPYSKETFSYLKVQKCTPLDSFKNYLITDNPKYCVLDINLKTKKIVCDNKFFKLILINSIQ